MFPFICGGDYLLVKKVPLETIRLGDAIVFQSDAKTKVCHRVVEIEKKDNILWFHTQGYKDTSSDAYAVRQEKVLGKVVAVKRKFGFFDLSGGGLQSLSFKFDCFLTGRIFYIKILLAKIPLLRKLYRYVRRKMNPARIFYG